MPIFDHKAHWAFFQLRMIEMHQMRRGTMTRMTIADLDLKNRLRLVVQRIPQTDARQQTLRRQRQRIGAAIEIARQLRAGFLSVDHRDPVPALGQRKRKDRAVQASTDDNNVRFRGHETQYARPIRIVHGRHCRYLGTKSKTGLDMQDWLKRSASDLGRDIGSGKIDPVSLTETYLDAIRAHPEHARIYARLTEHRALAEARASAQRARAGRRLSLLDGVPISWKDLFDTAGVQTEAGTALLKGRTPGADAEVLRHATGAGLVCLGKTHMSELAFSGLGLNPVTATPPNINDPAAAPGGSSSGAAASVAFGLAAAGIGSDTGGSVRAPAAWNDLVGLKTTSGRLSLNGVVPLILSFDTVGPLTRSTEDATHLLAAMEAGRPADLRGASLKDRRFAVLNTLALDDVEPAPAAAFEQSVNRLSEAGAIIEHLTLPEIEEAISLNACLYSAEAYGQWRNEIEASPQLMYPEILKRFRIGQSFDAADYVEGWQRLRQIRATYHAATRGYDAVLLPSSPILPPNVQRLETDDDYYARINLLALRNTRIGNLMGGSSLTLPTGIPSCGLMLMAPPLAEEALLRIGIAAERALA